MIDGLIEKLFFKLYGERVDFYFAPPIATFRVMLLHGHRKPRGFSDIFKLPPSSLANSGGTSIYPKGMVDTSPPFHVSVSSPPPSTLLSA